MTKITEINDGDYGNEPVMYQDMDHFLMEREQRIQKSRDLRKELNLRSENGRNKTQEYCNQRMTETMRFLRKLVDCENGLQSEPPMRPRKFFGNIRNMPHAYKVQLVRNDKSNMTVEREKKFEDDQSKQTRSPSPSPSQNSLEGSRDDVEDQAMNGSTESYEEVVKPKDNSETDSGSDDEVVKKTSINDEDDIYDNVESDEDDENVSRNDEQEVNKLKDEVKTLKSENNSLRIRNSELEEELEALRNRLNDKEDGEDKSDKSDADTKSEKEDSN